MEYQGQIVRSKIKPTKQILIATPTLGVVRMEWVHARYGQIIPTNWSTVLHTQFINSLIPMNYSVPDAQNIIVKSFLELGYEWLLLIEDDTCPPPDAFVRFNDYMRKATVPVVSGLYYTRSNPPEPMIYRGRGNSFYTNWKMGDKVWADGVPTGCLLIHKSILQSVYDESPEYKMSDGTRARRVFEVPEFMWNDEETGFLTTLGGTSDLEWCARVITEGHFKKAGWPQFQKKKYPFLVDTNIFCKHIDRNGTVYP